MKLSTASNILNSLSAAQKKETDKLLLPLLYQKAKQASVSYPEDITCREMLGFFHKKAQKNEVFLSVADLNTAYQTFYHSNNRFRDVFASELGQEEIKQETKQYPKLFDSNSSTDILTEAKKAASNEILENYFASKLSKDKKVIAFTKQSGQEAEEICSLELKIKGLPAHKVAAVGGNEDFILCSAEYETPKGITTFILPVEQVKNRILQPNLFLSASGVQDLTVENLQQEIQSSAGKSLNVKAEKILEILKTAKFGTAEENLVDRALAKKAMAETSYFDPNGIVFQFPEKQARQDVQLPKMPIPNEIAKIAEKMVSQVGRAELKFGKNNIEKSKSSIFNKLASCGYSNSQINILASDDQTVTYAVRFSPQQTIRVPVKINKESYEIPRIIIANGSIYDFSPSGISSALTENKIDSRALVATSAVHEMTPEELLSEVKKAVKKNNFKMAEEALLALKTASNHHLYQEGFKIYSSMLNGTGIQKEASVKKGCQHQIKTANSQHLVCLQTNLPVTKIYQDSQGRCRPLYRQNMSEEYPGANFMHYQLFWGKEV